MDFWIDVDDRIDANDRAIAELLLIMADLFSMESMEKLHDKGISEENRLWRQTCTKFRFLHEISKQSKFFNYIIVHRIGYESRNIKVMRSSNWYGSPLFIDYGFGFHKTTESDNIYMMELFENERDMIGTRTFAKNMCLFKKVEFMTRDWSWLTLELIYEKYFERSDIDDLDRLQNENQAIIEELQVYIEYVKENFAGEGSDKALMYIDLIEKWQSFWTAFRNDFMELYNDYRSRENGNFINEKNYISTELSIEKIKRAFFNDRDLGYFSKCHKLWRGYYKDGSLYNGYVYPFYGGFNFFIPASYINSKISTYRNISIQRDKSTRISM
ncbi:hypothetical protein ACFL2G_04355 [Candidatus Omnitrophota bacterium]